MGYADRMFEEALESLRDENKKLRDNLNKHFKLEQTFLISPMKCWVLFMLEVMKITSIL